MPVDQRSGIGLHLCCPLQLLAAERAIAKLQRTGRTRRARWDIAREVE